jgi:phosphate:Na+ symporter
MNKKGIVLTSVAVSELKVISAAVGEILDLSLTSFLNNDIETATKVEPLEQVIDQLKEQLRVRHILRLQQGVCTMEAGFVWSDLLTSLGRTSDHCSNIAACIIDMNNHGMNLHESLREFRNDSEEFRMQYKKYVSKYYIFDAN